MTHEEQLVVCENSLFEAVKKGDINVLDELIHDGLVFITPTGQTISKAMDIENYRSGIFKVREILASDRIITTIDHVSTVSVTVILKADYAGQAIEGKFKYLRVWKLFGGSWKIIAGSGIQIQ